MSSKFQTNLKYVTIFSIILIFCLMSFSSCFDKPATTSSIFADDPFYPDEPADTDEPFNTDDLPPTVDISVEQATADIGEEGGEVTLDDGASLTLPPEALSQTATIGLEKFETPQDFGSGAIAYEISGLAGVTGQIELTFPVENGLTDEEVNVFLYDTTAQQASDIPYIYDSTNGLVTVTIAPQVTASTGIMPPDVHMLMAQDPVTPQGLPSAIMDRFRILFTPEPVYVPINSDVLIPLPFYEQSGGSCWATDAEMLIAGYALPDQRQHLGNILRAAKAADEDFGLTGGWINYQELLPRYISAQTGAPVTWRGFINTDHLRWCLLRQLENGHPVILELSGIGHYVLVIGFRGSGNEFIIHDSRGISPADPGNDGGMYTVRSWSWIVERKGNLVTAAHLMWPDAKANPDNLLSIGCPGGSETGGSPFGVGLFYNINPVNNHRVELATLQFTPSSLNGIRWQNRLSTVNLVPAEATDFSLKLPVWNADFQKATVDVKIRIRNVGDTLFLWSQDAIQLPAANYNLTVPVSVTADIPVEEFRDLSKAADNGILKIDIDVMLMQGGSIKDTYTISASLSVVPVIENISPATASIGDTVTITGNCFGKNPSARSAVTIAGKSAPVQSWSNNKIMIQLTQDIDTGSDLPVLVITGEQYSYQSNQGSISITKQNSISGSFSYVDENLAGGLESTGTWNLSGANAELEDESSDYISLNVDNDAPARLVIRATAFLYEPSFIEENSDGSRDEYTLYTPILYPLSEDNTLGYTGDFDFTINSSGSTLTIDFTLTSGDQNISIDVYFEVRYDVKHYNDKGELEWSDTDKYWGESASVRFYVDSFYW